jgi:hypothetical protein
MVKQSYDDPVKEKWRHAWFKFIKKNKGFLGGNPREMTGVFFLGEDALELKVYDKLGIPRENLVGLEYDAEYYEKLKKKKLGIRMTDEPMDALDFFKETDEKFSFVNLDYTGHLNKNVIDTLENIAGRQLLKEDSLLGVTVYGKREKGKVKEYYESEIIKKDITKLMRNPLEYKKKDNLLRGLLEGNLDPKEFFKKRGYSNQREIKNHAITSLVCGCLGEGRYAIEKNPFFEESSQSHEVRKYVKAQALEISLKTSEEHVVGAIASGSSAKLFTEHLIEMGFNPQDARLYATFAVMNGAKSYLTKDLERYEYVSRNAALMLSDFARLSQERKSLEKYNYLTEGRYRHIDKIDFFENMLGRSITSKGDIKKLRKMVARDIRNLRPASGSSAERVFLGSSAKLPKLTGKEYYIERYSDHKKGISIRKTHKRLSKKFKNTTGGQLSSLEAHYTMETHGERYKDEVKIPNKGLENIVSLNKNQIIKPRNFKGLPENWKKRVEYFVGDDLVRLNLNQEDANYLAAEIKSVKWFDKFSDGKISDSQFYGFFDNLMLESVAGKKLKRGDIESIAKGVMSGGWKRVGIDFNKSKPMLTCEKYIELSEQGKEDGWILDNYKTNKPNSIGAYKAWDTMRKGEEKGERNTGYDVISMLREGSSKKEVMGKFNIDKMQLAGYLAANRRGSYRHLFGNESPSLYVDSRGVVHRNSDISDIEKGYK